MTPRIPLLIGDGGGIRAIWQMAFYRELSVRLQAPLSTVFKRGLIGGVSGGGINAGALVHPRGISPDEMIQLYVDEGPRIFARAFLEPPPLLEPKFEDNYLAETLQKHFGDATLNEALCPVFIPVWDLSRSEPWFYTETDYSPIWLACRATSAVPSYFKTWGPLVDGGVYGSNPVLWALAHARMKHGRDARFTVVSVGTGWSKTEVNSVGLHGAGQLAWLLPIIKTLADAGPTVTEQLAPWLVGPEDLYFRWQAPIPAGQSQSFDDGSKENTAALLKFHADVLASRQKDVAAICEALSAS